MSRQAPAVSCLLRECLRAARQRASLLEVGGAEVSGLFLVAPDDREDDVRRQLARPAMRAVSGLRVRYLPYGELEQNREAVARFGHGLKPIEALARSLA